MDYISVKAASEKSRISERRIQKLCEENRIDGTEKFGGAWMIPKDAEKPIDGRIKNAKVDKFNKHIWEDKMCCCKSNCKSDFLLADNHFGYCL